MDASFMNKMYYQWRKINKNHTGKVVTRQQADIAVLAMNKL